MLTCKMSKNNLMQCARIKLYKSSSGNYDVLPHRTKNDPLKASLVKIKLCLVKYVFIDTKYIC